MSELESQSLSGGGGGKIEEFPGKGGTPPAPAHEELDELIDEGEFEEEDDEDLDDDDED